MRGVLVLAVVLAACAPAAGPSGTRHAVAVVISARDAQGSVQIVDLEGERVVAHQATGYQPQAAVSPDAEVLYVLDSERRSSTLRALELPDLKERWRVDAPFPLQFKVMAAPTLAASGDGRTLFSLHMRVLRPGGDGFAPGAARWWVAVRDARTGALLMEHDLPVCGAATVDRGPSPDSGTIFCWHTGAVYSLSAGRREAREAGHVGSTVWAMQTAIDGRVIFVLRDLGVLSVDLATRRVERLRGGDNDTLIADHEMALASDASRLCVITHPRAPEMLRGSHLTCLDLIRGVRQDVPLDGIAAVALSRAVPVYVAAGRLRALDGSLDIELDGVAEAEDVRLLLGQ